MQQRYAGDNSAAIGSGVLNGDDDIMDVNLPYDDSNDADADADDGDAADIVSSLRSFVLFLLPNDYDGGICMQFRCHCYTL